MKKGLAITKRPWLICGCILAILCVWLILDAASKGKDEEVKKSMSSARKERVHGFVHAQSQVTGSLLASCANNALRQA